MNEETVARQPGALRPEPLKDFSRSHAGILVRLEQLRDLPRRLGDPRVERRAVRETAIALLAFFREAVVEHHEEEERALFPAVESSAAAGEDAALVAELGARLTREHRRAELDWKAIEPALAKIARGRLAELDAGIVSRLCDSYAAHAQFEERVYLPLAARILDGPAGALLATTLHTRHAVDRVFDNL